LPQISTPPHDVATPLRILQRRGPLPLIDAGLNLQHGVKRCNREPLPLSLQPSLLWRLPILATLGNVLEPETCGDRHQINALEALDALESSLM
jgi:hypothetical protein